MSLRTLVVSCLIIFFVSCKTSLEVVKPVEEYTVVKREPKLSVLAVGVDIQVASLSAGINKVVKGLIYEDNQLEGDNLMLKVWKTQDFVFTVKDNKINSLIPLKIWVKTGFLKNVMGLPLTNYYEASGALVIDVSMSYKLQKDWTLLPVTTINSYQWTQKPTIQAFGMQIPITTVADVAMKSLKDKMNSSIDEAIKQNVTIKPQLESTWQALQKPLNINEAYDMWLQLSPKAIYSTPLVGVSDKISFHVGIETLIQTQVGQVPMASVPTKLPPYQEKAVIAPLFRLNSLISVAYPKISKIATDYLANKEFVEGKKVIKVTQVEVYGHQDKLVVALDMIGSIRGKVYAVGKPVYDSQSQSLLIKEFDFDVNTKNALVKSANWIMHGKFLKMVEPMLTISLKKEIGDIMTMSNTYLKNKEVVKGVFLQGNVSHFSVEEIVPAKESLLIYSEVGGTVKVDIGDLF